jgi:GMP synthase-like glutamine amidotransferase
MNGAWRIVVIDNYTDFGHSAKRLRQIKAQFPASTVWEVVKKYDAAYAWVQERCGQNGPIASISSGSEKNPGDDPTHAEALLWYSDALNTLQVPNLLICYSMQQLASRLSTAPAECIYPDGPRSSTAAWGARSVEYFHQWAVPEFTHGAVESLDRYWVDRGAPPGRPSRVSDRRNYVAAFRYGATTFACQFHPEAPSAGRPLLVDLASFLHGSRRHTSVCRYFGTDPGLGPGGSPPARVTEDLAGPLGRFRFHCTGPDSSASGLWTVLLLRGFIEDLYHLLERRAPHLLTELETRHREHWHLGRGGVEVFITLCDRPLTLPRHAWPAPRDLNSGFQPDCCPQLHLCRQNSLREVFFHEFLHYTLGTALHHRVGALFPEPPFAELRGVYRPIEGYVQFLVDHLLCRRPADCTRYLSSACHYLLKVLHRVQPVVQETDTFSYFFGRLALWFLTDRSSGPLPVDPVPLLEEADRLLQNTHPGSRAFWTGILREPPLANPTELTMNHVPPTGGSRQVMAGRGAAPNPSGSLPSELGTVFPELRVSGQGTGSDLETIFQERETAGGGSVCSANKK